MQRKLFLLACLFSCTNLFAQQYPFVHYTPKDGLVNSRVRKAFQDSKGRMYFLTFGGLSVYDGARFKNYTIQNGLASTLVNDIIEVGRDSFLIAANSEESLNVLVNGKIGKLNTGTGRIPVINQFYRHDDGKIYLSSDHGLYLLEKTRIRELNKSILLNLRSISGLGNWLVLSSNEMKFPQGLYLYNISQNYVSDSLSGVIYLHGKDIQNRIWFSRDNQLYILDNNQLNRGKLSATTQPDPLFQNKDNNLTHLRFDNNHTWYINRNKEFQNQGVQRIDEKGRLLNLPLVDQATSSVITDLFIDREKTIWLCNDGEGVFKIVNSPLRVIDFPPGQSKKMFVDHTYYRDNTTWFSTTTNKLFRKTDDQLEEYKCNLSNSPRIFHHDGIRLLGLADRIVYEGMINSTGKTIQFRELFSIQGFDFFGKANLVDRNKNIITTQQAGLFVRKNQNPVFHIPMPISDLIDELFLDNQNHLWAIKRYTGIDVFKINKESDSSYLQTVFHFSKNQLTGSPRSAVIDKSGLIWIGTREHGVICYRQQGNLLKKLHEFNTQNGLTDNFVTALVCDSANNIIAGTQSGLDRIIRNREQITGIENLSKNSNIFSLISQVWAEKSIVYSLGYSGIMLQLSPPEEKKPQFTPQLLLEEIKVNSNPVSIEKSQFRWKENNISFAMAAPSFIDEKQVTFSYILEGSGNTQWSDTAAANATINLTNLSDGEYVLKVKAFFPSATYNAIDYTYAFEITPPWWQTWWFLVITGLFIIGLLVIALRFYYRRKLEKQMVILEKQQAIEKERTRIATDMHDDLGAGLSRIKFLSETIGIKKQKQETFEEDISKIREYSHEMIDKMGEIVWALNEKNDTLSDLLSYTRAYAVEYLTQNGIQCNVKFPEQIPAGFVSGEFRRNIFLTIKEALHNVVKHSRASEVNFDININHRLQIHLKDNGIGFEPDKIRAYGNGLSNMKSRIKESGGQVEIINKAGTIVNISIPLP